MFKIFTKSNVKERKYFIFSISNGIKKNLFNILLVAFLLLLPIISFADSTLPVDPNVSNQLTNPIESTTLTDFIRKVLEGIVKLGMPIIVIAIIYSGFLFVAAQGNSEKLDEAKRTLLYTLIGAAILLGSWGLAQLITETVKAL